MVVDVSQKVSLLKSVRFRDKELKSIIQKMDLEKFSGYLQIEFNKKLSQEKSNSWYLFFAKGKVVFSSQELLSFTNVLETLQKFVPSLRANNPKVEKKIQTIVQKAKTQNLSMLRLLSGLTLNSQSIDYRELTKAIKQSIIADLDRYLFIDSGQAKFFIDEQVKHLRPVVGFELPQLLTTAKERRIQWQKIFKIIPSMDCRIRCNTKSPRWQKLPQQKIKKIEQLVKTGQTLEDIRYNLGEDSLKIAQIFAKLIKEELVIIDSDLDDFSIDSEQPYIESVSNEENLSEVLIIDDSPILIKNFASIVTDLGYIVRSCEDALNAIQVLLEYKPQIVFIDVNMPKLSGFQLMKMIRMEPELTQIPLVILTAEKTIMNKQRAKWAKSKFLSKPLNSDDTLRFQLELEKLLSEMAPIPQ